MSASTHQLLPEGRDVPFERIAGVLARSGSRGGRASAGRALSATVVAVGAAPRLSDAARALEELAAHVGLRSILIGIERDARPVHRVQGELVALGGLQPEFVNNAVAALRLSSLPTVVWWRGGAADLLPALAHLADRVVLDEEAPREGWTQAAALLDSTAFSDLRWTRLTRWRSLMAQLFDMPDVRAASPGFTRLEIRGSDALSARLFAAWLRRALALPQLRLAFAQGGRGTLEWVRLGDDAHGVEITLAPSGKCVATRARVRGHEGAAKTVAFGDQGLPVLIAEELRVRARDRAFEDALLSVLEEPA